MLEPAKISEDDGAAHAPTRRTCTRTYFDTWNHGTKSKAGRAASHQESRTGQDYKRHPWDSGQEITGVQGSPAAYIQTLERAAVGGGGASCRRGRRGDRGRGFNRRRAAGLDFSTIRKSPAQPSTSSKMLGSSAPKSSVSFAST